MTTPKLALFAVAVAALSHGCDPVDTCDPDQYFRFGSCRPCPKDSVVEGQGCRCNDPAKEYRDRVCKLPVGALGDGGLSDASAGGDPCSDYCGFLKSCVADNTAVASVIAEVISAAGLEGGDPAMCEATCATDADEPANRAALACFVTAAQGASCAGDQTINGAGEALSIVDDCCTQHGGSEVCARLCAAIALSALALGETPACQ